MKDGTSQQAGLWAVREMARSRTIGRLASGTFKAAGQKEVCAGGVCMNQRECA